MNGTVFNFQSNTEFSFVVTPPKCEGSLAYYARIWQAVTDRLTDEFGCRRIPVTITWGRCAASSQGGFPAVGCESVVFSGVTQYAAPEGMQQWGDSVVAVCREVAKTISPDSHYGSVVFRECDVRRI